MEVTVIEAAPRKALCISHTGPYHLIGQTFARVGQWAKAAGIPLGETIGIYYDDPQTVPAEQLRSEAGVLIGEEGPAPDGTMHLVEIAGGTYAVARYIGSYEGLPCAWGEFAGSWLSGSGYVWGNGPGFEIYIDDCDLVEASKLRTDLYIPVSRTV